MEKSASPTPLLLLPPSIGFEEPTIRREQSSDTNATLIAVLPALPSNGSFLLNGGCRVSHAPETQMSEGQGSVLLHPSTCVPDAVPPPLALP